MMEKIAKLPGLYVEFVRGAFVDDIFAAFVFTITYAIAVVIWCTVWLLFLGGQFEFAWVITAPFVIPAPMWMIHLIQFRIWMMKRDA